MFRVSVLTMVCVVLVACVTTGCEKEEKFTFPENPAPWSPGLEPSGVGAGGGGGPRRPRRSETEQQDKQAAEESQEDGQASEGGQNSDASDDSNKADDEIKSEAQNDQQVTGGSDATSEKSGEEKGGEGE